MSRRAGLHYPGPLLIHQIRCSVGSPALRFSPFSWGDNGREVEAGVS